MADTGGEIEGCNFILVFVTTFYSIFEDLIMAKGSSINGNGGGKNGGNKSYTVTGRGEVSRAKLVKEVKQGQHPDTHVYKREGVEYARNNPNHDKPDNIND